LTISIRIHENATGETRTIESEEYGDLAQAHFIWSEGNYGCDCNRFLFFHDFPEGVESPSCDDNLFSVELSCDEGVFYSDGWFLKPRELTFDNVMEALGGREPEWHHSPDCPPVSLSFRGMELGGEAGELLNELKKVERVRFGLAGGKEPDMEKIEEEIGDVILTTALIARQLNIDLAGAVLNKFNKTSKKMGFDTRL